MWWGNAELTGDFKSVYLEYFPPKPELLMENTETILGRGLFLTFMLTKKIERSQKIPFQLTSTRVTI